MAVRRQKADAQVPKKPKTSKIDKAFAAALSNLEVLAKERIDSAKDPVSTGLKIASQIRRLAERIDDEVRAESLANTEASYASDVIGVTIGVL